MRLVNGIACNHKGCLSHTTHPCETCGRVGGYPVLPYNVEVPIKDIHKIEEARLHLIRLLESTELLNMSMITTIIAPIRTLTHAKYKQISDDNAEFLIGQRVLLSGNVIGTVCMPENDYSIGVWVHSLRSGFASCYAEHNVKPLPNGQL